jgi:hypothetical protein
MTQQRLGQLGVGKPERLTVAVEQTFCWRVTGQAMNVRERPSLALGPAQRIGRADQVIPGDKRNDDAWAT